MSRPAPSYISSSGALIARPLHVRIKDFGAGYLTLLYLFFETLFLVSAGRPIIPRGMFLALAGDEAKRRKMRTVGAVDHAHGSRHRYIPSRSYLRPVAYPMITAERSRTIADAYLFLLTAPGQSSRFHRPIHSRQEVRPGALRW
jgi:hypothetical protein